MRKRPTERLNRMVSNHPGHEHDYLTERQKLWDGVRTILAFIDNHPTDFSKADLVKIDEALITLGIDAQKELKL